MAFQNSFTGKGIYQPAPSGEGMHRAQEKMSDLILSADKLKYDTFKKNEEEFLKASHVAPEFFITKANREYQERRIGEFNDKWGKVFQQYNGNLPLSEKTKMANDRDFLMMEQGKMKADMEQAITEKQMISKDMRGELDHDQWSKKWTDYMKYGTYDTTPIMPSELDPELFFNNSTNKLRGTSSVISKTRKTPEGTLETVKSEASGTEEEAREYVKAHLYNPGIGDRMLRGVLKQFEELKTKDPKEYKRYVESSENPILQFAQDKYWEKTLVTKDIETVKPVTEAKTTSFNWNIGIGGDHNQNNKFNVQKDIPIALEDGNTVTLPDYMNLGQVSSTTDPQNIVEYITQDAQGKETRVPLNETARFDIVGYSPSKDVLIIKLADKSSGQTFRPGSVLMVDASRYDDLLKKKPFGIFRGQNTTAAPVVKKKAY